MNSYMLQPIIGRITIKRSSKNFLQIGDQEVEVSPNFRLYLVSLFRCSLHIRNIFVS
jgi:hypothetical protein